MTERAPAGAVDDIAFALLRRLRGLEKIGAAPGDGDEDRLQKTLLVASTLMMASLAVAWGALYAGFGERQAAAIPLAYAVASFASLAVFAHVRRYGLFRSSQLALSLVLPFFLMLSLGGFVGSSAVILWSLTSPLGALVFAGRRPAAGWFAAYLILIVAGAALGGLRESSLPGDLVTILFVMNLGGVSVVAFVLLQYFVGEKNLALTLLDRERRWIHDAFSSYVSPNLVRHLLDHPDELRLGGERRECSFVLTDLAGFTALVERADPERVVEVLNEYVEGMAQIALDAEGTLDRIVGDAVAVLFSAPVAQADHAARAVRCAMAMDRFATTFARRLAAEGLPAGGTRIGVSSGRVIVGHVGGRGRLDYRALGDPINTAQRLEDANRYLGTRVCVAGTTVAAVPGFVGRPVGLLRLAGKREPVEAWEALHPDAPAARTLARYGEAYACLARDAAAARRLFRALERDVPDDPLVRFHRQRLDTGGAGPIVDLARLDEPAPGLRGDAATPVPSATAGDGERFA